MTQERFGFEKKKKRFAKERREMRKKEVGNKYLGGGERKLLTLTPRKKCRSWSKKLDEKEGKTRRGEEKEKKGKRKPTGRRRRREEEKGRPSVILPFFLEKTAGTGIFREEKDLFGRAPTGGELRV